MKKMRTLLTLLLVSICAVHNAWADGEVTVTITDNIAGNLGHNILTSLQTQGLTEDVKTVTNLTVSGEMNEDDWISIRLLDALVNLDLENVNNEKIPTYQFQNNCPNLTTVKLPTNLKVIGEYAFDSKKNLTSCILPSGLQSIGKNAFNSCNKLQAIGSWPVSVTVIPEFCFYGCEVLQPFTIPEGVTSIGSSAFRACHLFKSTIPSTIKNIGGSAFLSKSNANEMEDIDVVIPEGATVGNNAFQYSKIKSIVYPTNFYSFCPTSTYLNQITRGCPNLLNVTFKAPTVVVPDNEPLDGCPSNLVIHVPNHLVSAYRLHSYWSNFTIEGYSTSSYTGVWPIQTELSLSATRMEGTPNISLYNNARLIISGDATQTFGSFNVMGNSNTNAYSDDKKDWAMVLSTCDNVSITGEYTHRYYTIAKKWYFISLPFDFNVDDIVVDNDVKFAIRYYDGASRATNNSSTGNWKNYTAGTVITAGTGFIFQTSQATWTTFKAQNNASRNNVVKNEIFNKFLAGNNTSEAAHKGWNLVGNPWQCYYNIHKMNFTAPISVYEGASYTAYSKIDDDYAIQPNQAFFVQCPDEVTVIGFPTDGRQLTEEITSQATAPRRADGTSGRWLIDLQLTDDAQQKDKTRLVVNNDASMDYELSCDASKFMSLDGTVPQIYSMDSNSTQYAINERPLGNGELQLGIIIKREGLHTLEAVRNSMGQVLLTDNETGITTNLEEHGYSFDAKAGSYDNRFTLKFINSAVTGIGSIEKTTTSDTYIYTLDGRTVGNDTNTLKSGVYVVRNGKKVQKVVVK